MIKLKNSQKKALASGVKKLDYLTTLYKQETEASKRRMAEKAGAKKKAPTYNVNFRVLTIDTEESQLSKEKKEIN